MFKISISQILFSPIVFLLTQNAFGQNDQQAIKILEKFSTSAVAAPSVSMKFLLITTNLKENTNDTLPGFIILSKDKYKLDLTDNIIWFNGETSWSLLPAEKEVTITKADKKDNSFQNRPSAIFSLYKNGYKSRLIEERPDSYIIDLYPEDIKSDLIRIRLSIGKSRMNLKSLEYVKKNGFVIALHVSEYNLNLKPEADEFIFLPDKFKGVEVVDMR